MKSFEHWESEEVELTFGVKRVYKMPRMDTWLESDLPISEEEHKQIKKLQHKLLINTDYWQEDEIKSFFNIPLIEVVEFADENYEKYKTFTQRILSGKLKTVDGDVIELQGRVELVVAAGKQKPRQPFFFLNEYKPQLKGKNDPLGQLLIAMLVAQTNNQKEMPIYGIYIIGKFWNFVVLEGKEYVVSESFIATTEKIFQIVKILKATKEYVSTYFK
jgi:hypothetical protein